MPKEYTSSRTARRSGTKGKRVCSRCSRRVRQWMYVKHQRRHLENDLKTALGPNLTR